MKFMDLRLEKSAITQLAKPNWLKTTVLVLGIPFSSSLFAHEEPMEKGWCADGEIRILSTFNINANLLERFRSEDNLVCSQYRSCGQFDDDYSLAMRTAHAMCLSFDLHERLGLNDGYYGTVRPIIHGPASLKNSEDNHHLLYNIEQGAHFSCAVCIKRYVDPVKEDRAR